jgi:hypothetical protein
LQFSWSAFCVSRFGRRNELAGLREQDHVACNSAVKRRILLYATRLLSASWCRRLARSARTGLPLTSLPATSICSAHSSFASTQRGNTAYGFLSNRCCRKSWYPAAADATTTPATMGLTTTITNGDLPSRYRSHPRFPSLLLGAWTLGSRWRCGTDARTGRCGVA